ncbi:putative bifunctional diguanylate cyclase/phosphodiesterase [Bacillus solitudinis]|uniref:putative bifunctional diguanylate cyclase/phosphodiesterase n=1 Tax=Bacillus solitudinis TaxID=2014074 RepID=UPI000C24FB74|nr:EAL domain-containing protein [Bacillus solitudinis]
MRQEDMEKRLKEIEQQFQSLFHYNTNAIFVLNRLGSFIRVNPSSTLITGYLEKELLSLEFEKLVCSKDLIRAQEYVNLALDGQSETFEVEMVHQQGKRLYMNVTLIPSLVEGRVEGIIGIAQDMTKRKHAEEQIKKIANEDELTKLPNRRYFHEVLKKAIAEAELEKNNLAVLFIDLDRFKLVNDTLGHFFGDAALKMLADRLHNGIGEHDVLARMGGDEFIVFLPSSSYPLVNEVASKLLKLIREPLLIDDYEFTITGSIGISTYPENGRDAEALIRSADAAMYRAKASGGDVFKHYNREMNDEFYELFHVENDLRKALERGEFKLYFQPQFETKSGKLCGEEVLVRWNHPNEGLVGPSKFISIAEETGLIIPIGEWILREACHQKSRWIKSGLPAVPMSVNVSQRQFLQVKFFEKIQSILKETELPPQYLDLEVTESVTIDINRTLAVLSNLTQLGINISLDDFGTGYSSLKYVSQLPIQELKIDQSFISGIGKGLNSEGIISLIINLAHLLGLVVIAEGVEKKEQLDYLASQGCDRIQGFLHSKPLSLQEYEEYLKKL